MKLPLSGTRQSGTRYNGGAPSSEEQDAMADRPEMQIVYCVP